MPDPIPFVPLKTLSEEQAEGANIDAVEPTEGTTPADAAPGQVPPPGPHTPTAPTGESSVPAPSAEELAKRAEGQQFMDAHGLAQPTRSVDETIKGMERGADHSDPRSLPGSPHQLTDPTALIKEGRNGILKLQEAQAKGGPDRTINAQEVLSKDELAGVQYLQQQQGELSAAEQKAVDEARVPTAAKPFVAAAKGVANAVVNTLKAIPATPEAQGGNTDAIPQVGGATGEMIAGATQFATDFVLAGKVLKATKILGAAGGFTEAAVQGAAADALAFDPHAPRLSNFVQQATQDKPWLLSPLTDFLASDPNDSDAMGRFKNAIEGFMVGSALESVTRTATALKDVVVAGRSGGAEAADKALVEAADSLDKEGQQAALPAPERSPAPSTGAPEAAAPVETPSLPSATEDHLKEAADEYLKADQGGQMDTIWNHSRIDKPMDERAVLEFIGKKAADNVDLKSVQPMQEITDLAHSSGFSEDEIMAGLSEMADNADKMNAIIFNARQRQNAVASAIVKESRIASATGDKTQLNFLVKQLQNMQEALLPVRRAQGRGLNMWKAISDDSFSMMQLQAIAASGGNPAAIRKIVQSRTALQKGWGAFMSVWTNGLLSSPATHERNILGNLTNAVFKPAMAFAGAATDLAFAHSDAIRSAAFGDMGESISRLAGLYHGFADSFSLMKKAFAAGRPILNSTTKTEGIAGAGLAPKALGIDPTTWLGWAVNGVNKVVTLPDRFLTAADEFGMQINYRAQRYAKLSREAAENGLTGSAAEQYVSREMENSFDVTKIMDKDVKGVANNGEALDYALHASYKEEPGYIGKGVLALAREAPVVRLFVPFIKTLNNITRQAVEFGPGALASTKWWSDLQAGGLRRSEAVGKLVLGTGASYWAMGKVADGTITGSGPKDPALLKVLKDNQKGWQPFSFKIGDKYHSYLSLGHIGTMLAMVSTLGERAGNYDDNGRTSYAAHVASAFADALQSQTFAQGFSSLVEASHDDNAMQRWIQSQAASLVPAIVNDFREGTDTTKRVPATVGEAVKNRIPGGSNGYFPWLGDEVPSAYNVLGERQVLAHGVGPDEFAPWTNAMTVHSYTEDHHDPVFDEFARLQVPFDAVPRFLKLNDQQVDLSQIKNDKGVSAYDRINQMLAGEHKQSGKTLREELTDLITSDHYKSLPADVAKGFGESQRVIEIRNRIASYQLNAEGKLFAKNGEFPQMSTLKEQAAANANGFRNAGVAGVQNPIQDLLKQFTAPK